ncbi:hypothetical protein PATA110615_19905 [Paenibacillus taichungensis]
MKSCRVVAVHTLKCSYIQQSGRSGYESFFRSLLSLKFLDELYKRLKFEDKGERLRFFRIDFVTSTALARITVALAVAPNASKKHEP